MQLGVFAGPFDTAAAVAVCGTTQPAAEVTERLAELAEHSLLEVTPGSVPRFAMLATVREYALARLAETGWADQAHTRHLRHYLDLTTQARGQLVGAAQREWLDRLEAEFANIRAALDWARARAEPDGSSRQDGSSLEDGLRLATAVGLVWRRRGSMAEGALYWSTYWRSTPVRARPHRPPGRGPCWRPAPWPVCAVIIRPLLTLAVRAWRLCERSATGPGWSGRIVISVRPPSPTATWPSPSPVSTIS